VPNAHASRELWKLQRNDQRADSHACRQANNTAIQRCDVRTNFFSFFFCFFSQFEAGTTGDEVRRAIWEKYTKMDPGETRGKDALQYAIKNLATRSFIVGNTKLIDFECVRSAFMQGKPISFVLLQMPPVEPNEYILDRVLITQAREQESIEQAKLTRSKLIWEIDAEFR
jgi:hypothetical protein